MKTYIREFNTKEKATQMMTMKNRAFRMANNYRDTYCLVNGPSNNFAVVDLITAIELKSGYSIKY